MARHLNNSMAQSPLNVDEEYTNALRTKSYVDMWSKVHHQLHLTTSSSSSSTTTTTTPTSRTKEEEIKEKDEEASKLHTHPSPLSYRHYSHLPDFLLEPSQESLISAATSDESSCTSSHFRVHSLLTDFFNTTLQAFTACSSLLASIDRTRSHHRSIRRLLLKLSSRSSNSTFSELASTIDLANPLSPQNLSHFHLIHSCYAPLVRRLTSTHRRILRRIKLVRLVKKAWGLAVVAVVGAIAVAAAVLASHAAAVAAAPVVAAVAPGWVRRRVGYWERAGKRVDAAAKGAYIVGRDMDTMNQMVRRLHDEVEHRRDVARMVVGKRERQLVREVVREMEQGGDEVEEQLEELEEHVYLCLLTINRSRRLVAQEMMAPLI